MIIKELEFTLPTIHDTDALCNTNNTQDFACDTELMVSVKFLQLQNKLLID